ncbi:hypothetical protein ACLEPN_19385 [Myxococcus sp. 1LA]
MGLGRPGGQEATERTLAMELRVTQAQVRRLRDEGLEKLRAQLNAQGLGPGEEAPPKRGELRRRRAASARRGHLLATGQMPLLALAGRA